MRVGAVGADARVEVQLIAALSTRLRLHPAHERVGVAATLQGGARDEVVDVEEPASGEVLAIRKPATEAASASPRSNDAMTR